MANVADEFEFITRELPQVKEIFVEGDTLTVDQRYAVALAEELIRRGNRLPFTANSRADVSLETLRRLKQAGLRLLCVGFENGDQDVWLTLDGLHRSVVGLPDFPAEDVARWCDDARRSFYLRPRYILAKAWQIIAHPGETQRILRAARVFVRYLFRCSI